MKKTEFAIAAPYDMDVRSLGVYHLIPLGYTMVSAREISPNPSSIVIAINMSVSDLKSYRDNNYAGKLISVRTNKAKTAIDRKDILQLLKIIKDIPTMTIDYKDTETTGGCLHINTVKEIHQLAFGRTIDVSCKDGHIESAKGDTIKLVTGDDQYVALYGYRTIKAGLSKMKELSAGEIKYKEAIVLETLVSLARGSGKEAISRIKSYGLPVITSPTGMTPVGYYQTLGFRKTASGNNLLWMPPVTLGTKIPSKRTVIYTNNPVQLHPRI